MNKKTAYFYKERERQTKLLGTDLFDGATGGGYCMTDEGRKPFDFILKPEDSVLNLYPSIREDVLQYFERYDIAWWRQYEDRYFPTGQAHSSQINCLNHLFAIRKDEDAVLQMIKPVGEAAGIHFDKILPSFIDTHEAYFDSAANKAVSNSNFISFEFVCHNIDLIDESHEKRGANCTSVDAFVYAQAGKEKWLIPIEWKYLEAYDHQFETNSYARYIRMPGERSRLSSWGDLYKVDPFYELGRQTLLMERLIEKKPLVGKISKKYPQHPLAADNFLHIVVIPEGNTEMRADAVTFKESLREDHREYFQIVSPDILMSPLEPKYPELINYLRRRYW